jgi:hypothetical protein
MTIDELCEALHCEILLYYFAQRESWFEIRVSESLNLDMNYYHSDGLWQSEVVVLHYEIRLFI